ncbi:cysteine desulfurase [Candidatus Parcubacteria bacterium]|jgi:cysteine desulfurase|nr:MAG: cysteine desulfurase [Candidatus Parcubacteria bacterium]
MRRIYLDYAATTPVRKEVIKAMIPYFNIKFGNPGSLHSFGQEAMGAIDGARERIAKIFDVDFRGVLFCGSATEANNLALRGVVANWRGNGVPRVVISSIEHESVLETARTLEREKKIDLVLLPVDEDGIILLDELKKSLTKNTALVSIMYVNNEIGSVQPIKEISCIVSDFKKSLPPNPHPLTPIFHTDAVQAFSYFDCSLKELGVDVLTVSGHKCGGPKGVGVLVSTLPPNPHPLTPIITGGGQEFGLRSGTENVQNIVGCTEAFSVAQKNRKKELKRVELLRKEFIKGFLKIFPESKINGVGKHAPHIVNIHLQEMNREEFLTQADLLGVAFSSGSACSARAHSASHVLSAMYGGDDKKINGVRASFGYQTTKEDIVEALQRLSNIFGK